MKNYIDSEQHWMDSVNADYDRREQMNKDIEKQINAQIEAQIQGQNLPIGDVVEMCFDKLCDTEDLINGGSRCKNCGTYYDV